MENRDDMDVAADESRVQRACDACRSRKIRCDRQTPCSNCWSTCATAAPAQKPQRQRVHISDEYEKKIDRIEDRLAGIEHVLASLSAKLTRSDLSNTPSDQTSQSRSNKPSTDRSRRSDSEANAQTPAPFEGETTINSQSEFARELLAQAVGSTPSIEQNAEIKAALTSLQHMVSRQGQHAGTSITSASQPFFNRALADIDHTKLERPPWDAVQEIIEKASVYPTLSFTVVFPFLKLRNMKELFRDAFDTPADCTIGRRLLVYGVLYNLFTEFACYPVRQPRVESYRAHAKICKIHLECAISQLDLFLPPSYENILALCLAASFAIELCKPSLCWALISNAAGLSQSLGYHRIQTMKDDSEEDRHSKIHVFWFIYLMDKTLSLRLGRASIIQDWDISLPYPFLDSKNAEYRVGNMVEMGAKGSDMLLYWIKVAQIQGKAYEKLFSPAAFLTLPEQRARIATELVEALNRAWSERGDASALDFAFMRAKPPGTVPNPPGAGPNESELPSRRKRGTVTFPTLSQQSFGSEPMPRVQSEDQFNNVGDIFYHSDVVMHYSTCALIQRAVSRDYVTFDQACVESARAALLAHQRCSQQFNVKGNEDLWSGYVHWSILQAPFTPFIVVFCNAVLHCSPSDLASLADFVHTLESCRTLSEGADKLYKMCHLFLQVAKLYVEAKTKEKESSDRVAKAQSQSPSQAHQNGFYPAGRDEQGLDLSTMMQFDPYLSALGLMPNATWPMPGFPMNGANETLDAFQQPTGMDASLVGGTGFGDGGVGMGASGMQSGNQVLDWFSGSRYLMNLMEEDIQMPDLNS